MTEGKKKIEKIIESRTVTSSGKAKRVVIPSKIAEKLNLEGGDRVVFIAVDELVIIKNLDTLLPKELEDESVLLVLKLINDLMEIRKNIQEVEEKTIRREIGENEYKERVERLMKLAKEKYEVLKKVREYARIRETLEREMSFIYVDDLDKVFTAISIEMEKEEEENFLAMLEELRKFNEDVKKVRENLRLLEEAFRKSMITRDYYEKWKERYLGELTIAEERWKKVKNLLYTLEDS